MASVATGQLSFSGSSAPSDPDTSIASEHAFIEVSANEEFDSKQSSAATASGSVDCVGGELPKEIPSEEETASSDKSSEEDDDVKSSIENLATMLDSDSEDESREVVLDDVKESRDYRWLSLYICLIVSGVALITLGVILGTGSGIKSGQAALKTLSTLAPSFAPSTSPSSVPTVSPSMNPSDCPSNTPSTAPSAAPSATPSNHPSLLPTTSPSKPPSSAPSSAPSTTPSASPTSAPSKTPTLSSAPSASPTPAPTAQPSASAAPSGCPSDMPSTAPSITPQPTLIQATFVAGELTHLEVGLLLSEGLRARLIARTGDKVEYVDGSESDIVFHGRPDFGATFPDTRLNNPGGWVYTSNSEMEEEGEGGVGSFTFDQFGNVIDYKMVLEGTTMNCGGGRTPWNTWVSCEEVEFTGLIYQVDPFGERPAEQMTIGMETGRWESFAYDVRNRDIPRFFATEDHNKGTVRRFTPANVTWDTPWDMLHTEGVVDYLIVYPNEQRTGGTFEWTNDANAAKSNARTYYPQSEGIDIYGHEMYIVCKRIKQMFTFDLDSMTYFNQSTVTGLFDGGPDQMKRIVGNSDDLLFFTEEGGRDAGIHARDGEGRFFTILESPEYEDETTGLAFSPDGKHMYVAYQHNGLLFDVWREDGLPFQARTLNVKYHQRDQP